MTSRKPHRFPRNMPWWHSRVIVGSLIAAGAAALKQTGWVQDIGPEAIAKWTDFAMLAITVISAGVAVHGRIDQETAPTITLGKKP